MDDWPFMAHSSFHYVRLTFTNETNKIWQCHLTDISKQTKNGCCSKKIVHPAGNLFNYLHPDKRKHHQVSKYNLLVFLLSPGSHMLSQDATECACARPGSSQHVAAASHVIWADFFYLFSLHYSSLRWASIADHCWVTMVCVCICVCLTMTHSELLDRWGQQSRIGQHRFYTRKIATYIRLHNERHCISLLTF